VTDKTVEWNLGFAQGEVVEGLEKLLTQAGYPYTRIEADAEVQFQVILPSGSLRLVVRPLPSHHSPFNPQVLFHRTLLLMTFADVSIQEEEAFLHRLTLTFLRAGG